MASATPRPPLSIAQVVVVGLIAPAAFVAADIWLIQRLNSARQAGELMIALVFEIGALGLLCARLTGPTWIRWVVYGWGFALLNAIILSLVDGYPSRGSSPTILLLTALLAAQLGLVSVWAVLGTNSWRIRWPLALALVAILSAPVVGRRFASADKFSMLFLTQAVAAALICTVLRWRRFRLYPPPTQSDAVAGAGDSFGHRQLVGSQFGVRDVLIWTTSLAVTLALVRAVDLFSPERVHALLGRRWIVLLSASLLVAIALVVAMWAALGSGTRSLRWTLLVCICMASGFSLAVTDWLVTGRHFWRQPTAGARSVRIRWEWSRDFWTHFLDIEWNLIAWVVLAGGLLFASLLIFRSLGYRLSRVPTSSA